MTAPTSDPDIRFPAIEISDCFGVVHKRATGCNALAWKNGFFGKLAYFDSAGRLWTATRATPQRELTFLDRLLNRHFQVDAEFALRTDRAMDEAKRRLCELIDNDPDDLYDQFISHSKLKAKVQAAATPAELIAIAESLGLEDEDLSDEEEDE